MTARLDMIRSTPWSRVLCLYHYPCPDGIFAALAVNLFHKQNNLATNLSFVPNKTWDPVNVDALELKGDELVYLVDFSGPPGFALDLSQRAGRCIVLDHHKTAMAELTSIDTSATPNLEINFDMHRCGATIALDYFKPEITVDQQQMYQHIQDADLWTWTLPNSKAFHAGLNSLGMEWDATVNPSVFDQLLTLTTHQLIEQGEQQLAIQNAAIAQALGSAFEVQLGGAAGKERGWGRALAVIADDKTSSIRSQLGNELAAAASQRGLWPVGVVAYPVEGNFKVSLRSIGGRGDVGSDTTAISQTYGGGGHHNASSFTMETQEEFDAWRV